MDRRATGRVPGRQRIMDGPLFQGMITAKNDEELNELAKLPEFQNSRAAVVRAAIQVLYKRKLGGKKKEEVKA